MIVARFFGVCPNCSNEIHEGDQIGTPDHMEDWMCAECVETLNAEMYGQLVPFPTDRTATYLRVINSRDYRQFRAELLIGRGRKCALCGRQDLPFELHHNTYQHLLDYREHPEDVTILCVECHATHHGVRVAA